jgi:hypothetical protein
MVSLIPEIYADICVSRKMFILVTFKESNLALAVFPEIPMLFLFPGSNSVASVSVSRPIRRFYPSWPTDQTGGEHVVTGQAGQSGSSGENFLQFVRRIKNHIVERFS